MCRLLITLLVCCSLSALYVSGRVRSKNVIYPDFPDQQVAPSNRNGNDEVSSERTTRQTNNRRPLNGGPQTFPTNEEEDPFNGFDTPISQGVPNSNQPFGGNQFQWSNNGNGQRPNQQQANRPQNQWSNNGGGNQAQRPNNNNFNQNPNNQNFGGRPTQGQNQRPNNGGNQGQGNSRPTNQNQNQQQRPSSGVSEEQRNTCNTQCRERITNEYNPVCGSDSLTYQNRRFLNCVANCGIPTEFSYIGTCVSTTEGSVRK